MSRIRIVYLFNVNYKVLKKRTYREEGIKTNVSGGIEPGADNPWRRRGYGLVLSSETTQPRSNYVFGKVCQVETERTGRLQV